MTVQRHRTSAGLLVWRRTPGAGVEVLIGHMGGPLWARRTEHSWSVPKGEHGADEEPLAAALREFEEELGLPPPPGPYVPLGEVRQANGKLVRAWAVEGDVDPTAVAPGTFTMEWPPRSGRLREFPEIDRVEWVAPDEARVRLIKAQGAFLDRLSELT